MQQAIGRVLRLELIKESRSQLAFGGSQRFGVPFGAITIIDRNKGRLATLGQAHVVLFEIGVDVLAECVYFAPLLFGVWLGDTRCFPHALDLHVMRELDFTFLVAAADRRSRRGFGRAGERYVAFTRQQARGGIQADPARPREIDLTPGVQVSEIDFGAGRAIERFNVGLELNQVARRKACGHTEVAEQLHLQPPGVTAGA